MDLSRSLIKDFADVTSEQKTTNPSDSYVRGTARVQGEQKYVQIDGSDQLTPILETVDVQEGDRVLVSIKNHTATILGNFTFPPNARKEDEALDKAEDAGNTANEASQKAQESYDKANEASSAASDAKIHADAAKQAADQAQAAADEAKTSSEEAKTSAGSAIDKANEAYGKAQDAQDSVSEANNEISKINTEVNGVKDDINSALTDLGELAQETETIKSTMEVNYAKKTELSDVEASLKSEIVRSVSELQATISETYAAKSDVVSLEGKLQTQITQNAEGIASQASKVEKLEADTEAAQQAVNEAKQSATNAQNAANEALENAATAQENADAAAEAAKDAKEKADKASEEALNAAMDARVADEALTAARTALNEARKHYESVVNNPSSTAEEIEQAQAAVDEAVQNVNDALAAAATAAYAAEKAQEAANQASLDAETAQGVANDAQQKADSAKEVADNAQKAAQQAQEEVAALTKRVTTAETSISQNAEQISLTASKTEEIGDMLKNDYYNKTETDAAIKVTADGIKQEVSETYSEKSTVITSTREEFYLSTSPTSLSGGSWSSTQPTWTDGKFIWRRTLLTKGDGTTSYTPSEKGVCITGNTGAQGDPGSDGKGIANTHITYQASTSGTTVPTGTWTESIPSVAANQYLWTRTVITYTDGKTSTAYSVGKMGANGSPGSTGRGIESIKTEFYLSTSKTTQTGGSWTTAMPNWTSGKYLWTRSKIVYKNPAGTEYTAPVCDSSWEAVNEIDVGGRNLLLSTKSFSLASSTSIAGGLYSSIPVVNESYKGFTVRGTNNAPVNSYSMTYAEGRYISVEKGDIFTLSFYVKGTVSVFTIFFYGPEGYLKVESGIGSNGYTTSGLDGHIRFKPTSEWKKVWVTYKLFNDDSHGDPSLGKHILIRSDNNTVENASLYICGLKFEKGNKATDWTPAPEDVQTDIDDAVDQATTEITSQYKSLINETAKQIELMVEQLKTVTDGHTTSISSISNQLQITSEMAQFVKTTTEQLQDAIDGKLSATEVQEWARFDGANLELGASNSPFKCRLSTTELAFYQGANKVAWISNNELNILTAIIAKSIGCGNFTFVDEGNLGFSLI